MKGLKLGGLKHRFSLPALETEIQVWGVAPPGAPREGPFQARVWPLCPCRPQGS